MRPSSLSSPHPRIPPVKVLLQKQQLHITLQRLAHQLAEHHDDFKQAAIIGIQPRGVFLSDRIVEIMRGIVPGPIPYGKLDITFYRDDVHKGGGLHLPSANDIAFSVEGRAVVLIDDVLHTGRTIRAAMDALLAYGRPSRVELLALIDRRFSREVPVQPDYVGQSIDTIMSQKVRVDWEKEEVVLI